MVYNLTNITTGDISLLSFFTAGNEYTTGWFGLTLLLCAYLIPFIALVAPFGEKRSAATSSFIGALAALGLLLTNLIVFQYAAMAWVVTSGVLVWVVVSNN